MVHSINKAGIFWENSFSVAAFWDVENSGLFKAFPNQVQTVNSEGDQVLAPGLSMGLKRCWFN